MADAETERREGALTFARIEELNRKPVEGKFDVAHLRQVHRRIFQDLPHHLPGEFRPDAPRHIKGRQLEGSGQRYHVHYAPRSQVESGLAKALTGLREGEALKGVDGQGFAQRMAKLYAELDHLHPFAEGNSRTLRVFTGQLAQRAGYELNWTGTNVDAASRDRLYVARDKAVNERAFPGLDQERAMATADRAEYEAYVQVIARYQKAPDLQALIRDATQRAPKLMVASAGPADAALEPINRQKFADSDRARVQDEAIASATGRTELHIQRYLEDPRSFAGRYVSADLFKETFEQYVESKESRNLYNLPVHNSAAVLSAEQLRRLIAEVDPSRNKLIFLTGIPGAGKTSSVLVGDEATRSLPPIWRGIFEGQLLRPEATIPKIEQVLAAGLRPAIYVVHVTPELAMQRTLQRFEEEGRGAGIQTMATIQGGLPEGLRVVRERFGDKVELRVLDHRDPTRPLQHSGWDNLALLQSEGNREQVEQRLRAELERIKADRGISDAGYRQALGRAPLPDGRGMAAGRPGRDQADVARRELSAEDRATAFLSLSAESALKLDPRLSVAFEAMQAAKEYANVTFQEAGARATFVERTRTNIGELLRDGKEIPGPTISATTRKSGIRR